MLLSRCFTEGGHYARGDDSTSAWYHDRKTAFTLELCERGILSVGAEGDGCYQILTCEGGVINAKKPKDAIYDLKVGQAAMAKILSDDVHIAPERFPALPGWNQWIARVVLVDPGSYGQRVTAKVIGEPVDLDEHDVADADRPRPPKHGMS